MDGGSEVTSFCDATPGKGTSSVLKRVFDVLFASTVLLLVFPWLFPIIAAAIKLTSKGPVLFKQERWGENGRKIVCYKFRSMVATSRDVDENGRFQQATRDDPRLTSIGRFLRKTNLDELPQFLNVLKGEMSVVGPRPHPIPLDQEFQSAIPNYMLRHSVRPGITGLAQVSGYRGETRALELMRKRIEHDLWYIENWSFRLDLRIVALTAWQVLRFRS